MDLHDVRLLSAQVFSLARIPRRRYVTALGIALIVVVIWSWIGAHDLKTWAVENALVSGLLFVLIATYRHLPLSRVSYTLMFVFLVLHEIGAHWTYAQVPYSDAWHSIFDVTLNDWLGLERNHFDRLVHFSYGLLFAYPIRE